MSSTSTPITEDEGVVEQASAKVQDVAATAQEKAGELTSKGRSRLSEQLDQRTTDAGSQARSVAQALRQSTDRIEQEGNASAANVANRAADQIERVGSYLEDKSGDDILRDIEGFARRRPWLIAGLSLVGGVAASRFLKASSERRYSRSGTYRGYPAYDPSYDPYDGSRNVEPPQVTGGAYVGTSAYSTSAADDPLAPER